MRYAPPMASTVVRAAFAFACALPFALAVTAAPAQSQQETTAAIFDSPTAQTLLEDARSQAAANPAESARLLRRLLDDYGDRLVRSGGPADDLHRAAALEAEDFLRANPAVLARFRDFESRGAERMLAEEGPEATARRRRLTPSGLVATLALAEAALRSGGSDAAIDLVDRIAGHPDLKGEELLAATAIRAIARRDLGLAVEADRAALAALAEDPSLAGRGPQVAAALAALDRTAERRARSLATSPLGRGSGSAAPEGSWREIWSLELDETAFRRIFAGAVGLMNPKNVERARQDANWMTAAPTVVGNTIFLHEGFRVRALDADSRSELWSRELGVAGVEREFGSIGDLGAIAYDRGVVFLYEGHAFPNARTGSGRVWSLDAATGRTLWVTAVGRLDGGREELNGLFPVGSPEVFGDTVVVLARKPTQRLEQVDWVVGLDRSSGSVRWALSLAGTAGTRAIGGRRQAGVVRDGAYLVISTPLGVIARLRGADGQMRWLRRFPVPLRDPRFPSEPWEMGGGVAIGDRVISIAPDEFEIVALDRATGSLLETRAIGPGTQWESPRYLLSASLSDGTPLVLGIGSDIVAFDARDLSKRLWRLSERAREAGLERAQTDNRSGIRGRVSIAGERALVPGVGDLLVLDLASGRVGARIEVGHPGNAVLLDDRIVIAGDDVLKVLMPPDRAESILRARLAASPDDPSAALALVDLTLATGRPNLSLESARALEAAVARGFGDARLRQDAVDRLVDIANRHPEFGDDCYAIATRLSTALPALRVRVEIARGDFLLGSGRAPEAIACWRALSCDPELGAQLVERGRMVRAVRGEALARLARYASRDTELAALLERDAEAAVAALGGRAATPVQLAKAALAHPRTMAGARAAIDAVAGGARPELIHAALMDALVPPARVEVVDSLADAAARAASVVGGAQAERATRRRIAELLVASGIEREELRRLPGAFADLGREPLDGIDIPGRLVRTEIDAPEGASPSLLLAVQAGALARLGLEDLRPAWSLRLDDRDPLVVWSADRIVVWQSVAAIGESMLVLDPATGVPTRPAVRVADLWEAAKLIAPDQPGAQFAPDGGSFQPARIRPLCDGRSVHLVRANGDLARIGLDSPDAAPQLVRRALGVVFVSTLENGMLAIGGRDGSRDDPRSTVRVLDAVTLEERARFETRSATDVRWIRTTPLGEIYVGTVGGVEGWILSPDGGARPFLASADPECVQTSGPAIPLGGSLVVRDRVDVPLRIPILAGDPELVVLPEPPMGRSRTMRGMRLLEEGLLLHAEDRVAMLAHDGAIAGMDVSARERNFVFALPCRDTVLQIDGLGARQNEDVGASARIEFAYVLQALSRGAGLRLDADAFEMLCPNQRVDRAQVVDGWLLMSNVMGISAVRFPTGGAGTKPDDSGQP